MEQVPLQIIIKNPVAIRRVLDELGHGAGRNRAEVAENLILEGSEQRRRDRDRAEQLSVRERSEKVNSNRAAVV